ncbi:LytTR family DNA-binding domain-containing protein [Mesobacterium pallidum]|uniref:LytTR family DNA-binding domain-containing protein n=1 Tax=Mesobacterium pallidum TaxID=2872037 RepID=UPI001EE2562C|nr:LytTR family DNA-binding domain-containing protein [Mesobacterium pallidum]
MREVAIDLDWGRRLSLYGGFFLALVVLAPFETRDLAFWERVVFWAADISVVGFFMHVFIRTTVHAPRLRRLPHPLRMVLGSMAAAVPAGAGIIYLFLTIGRHETFPVHFAVLWAETSALGFLLFAIEYYIWPRRTAPAPGPADKDAPAVLEPGPEPLSPVEPPAIPRLAERLPPELREAPILSLSMQDHYVEVTTQDGAHLVLMRLSDAVDLLDGVPGARVHRSHWVSAGALAALEREGRRHAAVLRDGRRLPVSQSYLADAQALLNA